MALSEFIKVTNYQILRKVPFVRQRPICLRKHQSQKVADLQVVQHFDCSRFIIGSSFEPQRKKPYLRTCAPSKDSDQPAHLCSLIRIFTGGILDSRGCKVSSCGQRRLIRLRWLILVFVGHTCHKVRFLTLRVILIKCQ